MDPISQGLFGAATAHAVLGRRLPRAAALIGALAGMAPDLDIFLPSFGDPTAGWFWHRGPTHAVVATVLGAPIVAGLLLLISKRLREQPKLVLAAAAIGWASHGPLDALTSYGTMLWWPLSYQRVSLDWMPIIDPIWTLTMLALVLAAVFRKRVRWTRTSIAFCTIYFGFAAWQHGRALDATAAVAASRGHVPQNLRAMPSPTALSLWRGLYRTSDHAHAVGVFVPYLVGQPRVNPGPRALLADVDTAADSAEERRMFEVFNWFADGFAFVPDPSQPGRVADGRYSADAAGFASLWGLDLASDPPRRWSPDADFDAGRIVRATFGRDAEYRVLPED